MVQHLKKVNAMGIQNEITNVLSKTFFVTLLQVTLHVQHESNSEQHSAIGHSFH
jgi:hypothetical protein